MLRETEIGNLFNVEQASARGRTRRAKLRVAETG